MGETGCGKSTLARVVMRLYDATEGKIVFDGQDITQRQGRRPPGYPRNMQMVFQDPYASLNPRKTVGSIIGAPFRLHGTVPKNGVKAEVQELMELVGLNPEHYNRYPHEFSGGQRQRIGVARSLALRPKLIVCDEPVSALDVSIQAQILNLLEDLQKEFNLTYLFIAHDLSVVKHVSDRVAVMYLGKIVEAADGPSLYAHPRHPYTRGAALRRAGARTRSSRSRSAGSSWKVTCRPRSILRRAAGSTRGARSHGRSRRSEPEATSTLRWMPRCADEEPQFAAHGETQIAACHYPLDVPIIPTDSILSLRSRHGHHQRIVIVLLDPVVAVPDRDDPDALGTGERSVRHVRWHQHPLRRGTALERTLDRITVVTAIVFGLCNLFGSRGNGTRKGPFDPIARIAPTSEWRNLVDALG